MGQRLVTFSVVWKTTWYIRPWVAKAKEEGKSKSPCPKMETSHYWYMWMWRQQANIANFALQDRTEREEEGRHCIKSLDWE